LKKKASLGFEMRAAHIACVMLFAVILFLQAVVPIYAGAYWCNDWWMHYDIGRFYLDHAPLGTMWFGLYSATARTPLFDLAGAFFVSFANQFWSFQIVTAFFGSLFVIPLFLLAKKLYSERAGWIAVGIALLSPMLMTNEMYTWPKMLLAFFVLCAVYYYVDVRRAIKDGKFGNSIALLGFFAGLAYMTHQTALFYLAPIALDAVAVWLLTKRSFAGIPWRNLIVSIGLFALVVVPWHMWAVSTYGVERVISSSPAISDAATQTSWIGDRILNGLATISPVFQLSWYPKWFSSLQGAWTIATCPGFACKAALYSTTIRFWFDTILGGITLSVSIAAFLTLFFGLGSRKIKFEYSENAFLAMLLIVAFLLGIATAPMIDTKGWGSPLFVPLVALLAVVVSQLLARMSARLLAVVLSGALIEFLLVKASHIYLLATGAMGAAETWNNALKLDNHLVFASDLIGDWRWVLGALAIVVFACLLAFVAQKLRRK